MLGMDFVKANRETVARAIEVKGVDLDLEALLVLDSEVRGLKTEIEGLRAERNAFSAKFKDATPEEKAELGRNAKDAGARAAALEGALADKQAELNALMLKLPGIPYEGAPVGPDESANVVVRTVGEPPKFGFEPLDHVALIEKNDWGDLSRVTQVSGSRTYCLKGRLALLETKLMAFALERIANAGFTPITVPAIAREQAFLNQGQFPGHREETYELPNDDLWLAGTAEVVLTSLHSGEIIEPDKLPILYAGYSPCFRREAGSAGKDVRGLLRVHQFVKVEQYVICEADDEQSAQWHATAAGAGRGPARGAGNPLSGGRDLDRRHGPRQVSHERHRELGADTRQVSRDPQLLDAARLAGAAGEYPLSRRRRESAVRAHAQQHRAGEPENPRAIARKSSDGGRAGAAAQGAAGADGERVPLKYRFDRRRPAPVRLAAACTKRPGWSRASGAPSARPRPLGPEDGPPAWSFPVGWRATARRRLRQALAEAGWRCIGWELGLEPRSAAPNDDRLRQRLEDVGNGRKVLLVGWSLGGVYAREMARRRPSRSSRW